MRVGQPSRPRDKPAEERGGRKKGGEKYTLRLLNSASRSEKPEAENGPVNLRSLENERAE